MSSAEMFTQSATCKRQLFVSGWSHSADNKLMIVFLFFNRKEVWTFMQTNSLWDLGKTKKKNQNVLPRLLSIYKYLKMLSQHAN